MVSEKRESLGSLQVRRHRTVYRFGGAWAQALLSAIPWVTTLLLALLLMLLHGRLAITPGVAFDLPTAPLREGSRARLTALMLQVTRGNPPSGEETLIFFDDDRYVAQDPEQQLMLAGRLQDRMTLSRATRTGAAGGQTGAALACMRFVQTARKAGREARAGGGEAGTRLGAGVTACRMVSRGFPVSGPHHAPAGPVSVADVFGAGGLFRSGSNFPRKRFSMRRARLRLSLPRTPRMLGHPSMPLRCSAKPSWGGCLAE